MKKSTLWAAIAVATLFLSLADVKAQATNTFP